MNEFSTVKENLVKFPHNPKLNGNNNLTREKNYRYENDIK